MDYASAGPLRDAELFEVLVRPLPSGAKLTCVFDCCGSSGGFLNLPFLFAGTQGNQATACVEVARNWALRLEGRDDGDAAQLTDTASMGLGLWELDRRGQGADAGAANEEARPLQIGEVVAFAGRPASESGGYVDPRAARGGASRAGGPLAAAFEDCFGGGREPTYLSLLEAMRRGLAAESRPQVPQLASSLALDLDRPFRPDLGTLPPSPPAARGAQSTAAECGVAGFLAALRSDAAGAALIPPVGGGEPSVVRDHEGPAESRKEEQHNPMSVLTTAMLQSAFGRSQQAEPELEGKARPGTSSWIGGLLGEWFPADCEAESQNEAGDDSYIRGVYASD